MRILIVALAVMCGLQVSQVSARSERLASCVAQCEGLWVSCMAEFSDPVFCSSRVKKCKRKCHSKLTVYPPKKLPPFDTGCPPGQFWSKAQGKCIGSAIDRRRSGMERGRHGRRHEGR